MPMPEPEPESAFEVDVDAAFEALKAHGGLLTQCANGDPNLDLMAVETYSEGSCGVTWSHSSVLVVGKSGFGFRFHTPGTESPAPPPPPPPPVSVIVRAEKVVVDGRVLPSPKQLETAALVSWMKQKEKADLDARKARQEQKDNELLEKARKTLAEKEEAERQEREKKERREMKKRLNAWSTVNAYFHTVKQQHDQFGLKAHGPQLAQGPAAAAAAAACGVRLLRKRQALDALLVQFCILDGDARQGGTDLCEDWR